MNTQQHNINIIISTTNTQQQKRITTTRRREKMTALHTLSAIEATSVKRLVEQLEFDLRRATLQYGTESKTADEAVGHKG